MNLGLPAPGFPEMQALERPPVLGLFASALGVLVGLALVAFLIAGLLNIRKCDAQSVCLSYGGGPIESHHFQGVFEPSSRTRLNGAFDRWYPYPVSVRTYSVSSAAGEEGEKGVAAQGAEQRRDTIRAIPATTEDRVNVDWQVAVYFKLNANLVRQFHEQLGLRYRAYEDRGWDLMLRQTFRKQLETSLARVTRRYAVADVWSDEATLHQVEVAVGSTLKDQVNTALGGQYFCGPQLAPGRKGCPDFQLKVKKPGIPSRVQAAFEDNRTSEILVMTRTHEVRQRAKEAQAIRRLRGELTSEYVLLRAIERGDVDFWVLPQRGNVTLPTPRGAR